MDILILAMVAATGIAFFNAQQQKKRIALLSRVLGQYQIEALMENLTQGYLRALGEDDTERRDQIWSLLTGAETSIAEQFGRFARDFANVDAQAARVNRFPLPLLTGLLPQGSFDAREAFKIHARGIAEAVANEAQRSARDKAFVLSAELFLMQHTCHWFCRSRATASVRLLQRHQTSHEQVLASVSPATRRAYTELTGL